MVRRYIPLSSALKSLPPSKGDFLCFALVGLVILGAQARADDTLVAIASVETQPVVSSGDAADDPAIWVHPNDPAKSLIIGTDKDAGLGVYDLDGTQVQFLEDGELNNVDVRYGFSFGDATRDIVVAGNRTDNTMVIYFVDAETGRLGAAPVQSPVSLGFEVYGSCLYRSPKDGAFYAFFNSKEGMVQQWLLGASDGFVTATLARTFHVGGQTEGCVADDDLGVVYVGEENIGIWRYPAEPVERDEDEWRSLVDTTAGGGRLTADVEGLALIYTGDKTGYLIASSQGSDEFVVYRREGANEYVLSFGVGDGDGIDRVTGTDGIDVVASNLGPRFPAGLFVAQDDEDDSGTQNFKLVSWSAIAALANLPPATSAPVATNPEWTPRR